MKGQAWTLDFIIGITFFILAALFVLKFAINIFPSTDFDLVKEEAEFLSETLMGAGYPDNWNTTSVTQIGLLDSETKRLSEAKLGNFSQLGYYESKALLHVIPDFYFYFENSTGIMNISGSCGYGYNLTTANCTPDLSGESHEYLVRVERYPVYNNKIIKLVVLTWR